MTEDACGAVNAAKQFLFDRSFDPVCLGVSGDRGANTPDQREQAKKRPRTTITEDDVARAREAGIDEGRAQALAEAAGKAENRSAQALDAIANRLVQLLQDREQANAETQRDATKVAIAVMRKIAPEFCRRNALEEIENTVSHALSQVLGVPELSIRVAENLGDLVGERLSSLRLNSMSSTSLTIVSDPSLSEGDCRIEWIGGGAERNADATWNEIDAVIERNLEMLPTSTVDSEDHDPSGEDTATETVTQSDRACSTQVDLGENHD